MARKPPKKKPVRASSDALTKRAPAPPARVEDDDLRAASGGNAVQPSRSSSPSVSAWRCHIHPN